MLKTIEKMISVVFPSFPEVTNILLQSDEDIEKNRSIHFDPALHSISAFDYANPITRSLIWAIKYRKSAAAAKKAAIVLYPSIVKLISFYSNANIETTPARFFLVPIPLHKNKKRLRGFSQTELIANALLELDTVGILKNGAHLLEKQRATKSQNKLKNRNERLTNLVDSFHIPQPDLVTGAHIILIDDVITTGSTIKIARDTFLLHAPKLVLAASVAWQGLKR